MQVSVITVTFLLSVTGLFTAPTMDYVDPVTNKIVSPNVKNPDGTYGAPEQGDVGSNDSNFGK